jgi:hypothetical protein
MKTVFSLVLLLWAGTASAAFYFTPPRTVYHELAAPPIGESAFINYSEYPRLSADGSSIIYRVVQTNVWHVHVMNFDGSNDRVVDAITNGGYRAYVLNLDGSRQANANERSLRTGATSAGLGVEALVLDSGGINSPVLSDDGSKVYFCVYVDGTTAIDFEPVPRGLYEANADGSGRRLIAGLGAVAAKIGVPADEHVRFHFGAAATAAQRLVFAVTLHFNTSTNAIMGVNSDGTGLHVISYVGNALNDVALSRDGSTVAWGTYSEHVRVANFDGSHVRTVIRSTDAPALPLTLTSNGSHLMESGGRIYRTDGLGLRTVLYLPGSVIGPVLTAGATAWLAPSGQRGIFVGGRRAYGNQVCTFEFDPATLGGAPDITSHAVTPDYVRFAGASVATATAHAIITGTNRGVGTVSFRDGRLDDTFYLSLPLFDNGTSGDPVAGDSHYVNNALQSIYSDPALLGLRTLRFHAESTDPNGLRHATTVDHGAFFVMSNPPASSGGSAIFPGPLTSTNGGRRLIRVLGASFDPERTNTVVTLDGYPLDIISASSGELVVELPDWFPDGVYAMQAWNNGAVSEPVRYRTPGLPAPVLNPLARPVSNPIPLSWSAQLRTKYSVLGSSNLVNWVTLTNGVPGTSPTVDTMVDASVLGGKARFFEVLEEDGLLD